MFSIPQFFFVRHVLLVILQKYVNCEAFSPWISDKKNSPLTDAVCSFKLLHTNWKVMVSILSKFVQAVVDQVLMQTVKSKIFLILVFLWLHLQERQRKKFKVWIHYNIRFQLFCHLLVVVSYFLECDNHFLSHVFLIITSLILRVIMILIRKCWEVVLLCSSSLLYIEIL